MINIRWDCSCSCPYNKWAFFSLRRPYCILHPFLHSFAIVFLCNLFCHLYEEKTKQFYLNTLWNIIIIIIKWTTHKAFCCKVLILAKVWEYLFSCILFLWRFHHFYSGKCIPFFVFLFFRTVPYTVLKYYYYYY